MFSQFNATDDSPTIRYNASACTRCYRDKTKCSKELSSCIRCLKANAHCDYKRERAPYGVVPPTSSAYQSVQSQGTEHAILSNQFISGVYSPGDSNTDIWTDAYTTLNYGDGPVSEYNVRHDNYSSNQQLDQQQSPMTAMQNTTLPFDFINPNQHQQLSEYSETFQNVSFWENAGHVEQPMADSGSVISAEDCGCINRAERQLIRSTPPSDYMLFPLLSAARDGITDLAKMSRCKYCFYLSSVESLAILLTIIQGLVNQFDTLLGHCRSLENGCQDGDQAPVTIYIGSIYRALSTAEHVLLYISLVRLQVQCFLSQIELIEKAVRHIGTPAQHRVVVGHMRRMRDTQQTILMRKKAYLEAK